MAGLNDWSAIVSIIEQRREANSDQLRRMLAVQQRYNADLVVPVYDKPDEPQLPPLTPLLVTEAIDNVALQAAGTFPGMDSPALDPSKLDGVKSRDYAATRRSLLRSMHHYSRSKILLRRGYRHLGGYATMAMAVRPDLRRSLPDEHRGRPVFELRDPLQSYPEPRAPEDLSCPKNVGYVYSRPALWLRATYPAARRENGGPIAAPAKGSEELWDCVEWYDEQDCVIGIIGPRDRHCQSAQVGYGVAGPVLSMEIGRYAHRCEHGTPAIALPRVTMDRIQSQIANMVGMIDIGARMLALWMMAQEKAVFPDKYGVTDEQGNPEIITNGGEWADGRTGKMNLVSGVKQIGELRGTPDPLVGQFIDRLERNFRTSSGLVPQFGGETYGALRTGRGISELASIAVDPRVQELQEIVEYGLVELNSCGLSMMKNWCGGRKLVLMTGLRGPSALVTVEPTKHIETVENHVAYAVPGSDAQGVTIRLGQLYGAGVLSLATFRAKHPDIDDPEFEAHQREVEELELAALNSISQKAAAGQIPLRFMAILAKKRREGIDLLDAIIQSDDEMRELQAQEVAPTAPGDPNNPLAQPGLEGPAQAGTAELPGPAPAAGPEQFDQLVQAMRAQPPAVPA